MVLRRRGGKPVELIFTYNVTYALSEVPYSSRWDNYLMLEEGSQAHRLEIARDRPRSPEIAREQARASESKRDHRPQVHWLSLCGSLALSLLLASLVAAIMLATVRRDLQKYNAIDADDDLVEARRACPGAADACSRRLWNRSDGSTPTQTSSARRRARSPSRARSAPPSS